jgi:hypothetical protein
MNWNRKHWKTVANILSRIQGSVIGFFNTFYNQLVLTSNRALSLIYTIYSSPLHTHYDFTTFEAPNILAHIGWLDENKSLIKPLQDFSDSTFNTLNTSVQGTVYNSIQFNSILYYLCAESTATGQLQTQHR